MLPLAESPLYRLILRYRAVNPTDLMVRQTKSHAACRAEIWEAASVEEMLLADARINYNPSDDCRVKWLLEWCDTLEGRRTAIDDRLTAGMEFVSQFRPSLTGLSGKDRAAGEHLDQEPSTLAQGA